MLRKSKKPKRLKKPKSLGTTLIASGALIAVLAFGIFLMPKRSESKSLNASKQDNKVSGSSILIPVPVRSIAKGELLSQVPFTKVRWPNNALTEQYIKDVNDLESSHALTPLAKYAPIPFSSISNSNPGGNAVVEGIPEGMRAITVRVDSESAVEGWARSGSHVDVILIQSSNDIKSGLEAKVIAENIKILSANRSAAPLDGSPTAPAAPATVTLLVSQQDALKIKTATNLGKLTFALRGLGDSAPSSAKEIDQSYLANQKSKLTRQQAYRAFAKSPDGEIYTLSKSSEWIKSPFSPNSFEKTAESEEKNSQEKEEANETVETEDQ